MSTLRPLIESSSLERARVLLRAARADGPRPGAAGRTLTALGVVGTTAKVALATGGAAGAPAGALAGGSSSLAMIAAKWVFVGMLGGGALASSAALVFSEEPAAPAPAPAVLAPLPSATPTPAAEAAPATASTVEAAPVVPSANVASKPPSASAPSGSHAPSTPSTPPTPFAAPSQAAFEAPEQSKLLHDIALLDDARRALRSGKPAQAKAALGRYESERLTHVLDREAQLTRIDVLTALGEHALARQLATKYVATFPNDAYVGRLQTLINDGK